MRTFKEKKKGTKLVDDKKQFVYKKYGNTEAAFDLINKLSEKRKGNLILYLEHQPIVILVLSHINMNLLFVGSNIPQKHTPTKNGVILLEIKKLPNEKRKAFLPRSRLVNWIFKNQGEFHKQ